MKDRFVAALVRMTDVKMRCVVLLGFCDLLQCLMQAADMLTLLVANHT